MKTDASSLPCRGAGRRALVRAGVLAGVALATMPGLTAQAKAQSAPLDQAACSETARATLEGTAGLAVTVWSIDEGNCANAGRLAQCLAAAGRQSDVAARTEAFKECLGGALPEGWERQTATPDVLATAIRKTADRRQQARDLPSSGMGAGCAGDSGFSPVAEGGTTVGGGVQEVAHAVITIGPFVIAFDKFMDARTEYIESVADAETQPEQTERLQENTRALELTAEAADKGSKVPSSTDKEGLLAWAAKYAAEKWHELTGEPASETEPDGEEAQQGQPDVPDEERERPPGTGEGCERDPRLSECETKGWSTPDCELLAEQLRDPNCDSTRMLTDPDGASPCAGNAPTVEEIEEAIERACLSAPVTPVDPDATPCRQASANSGTPSGQVGDDVGCGDPERMVEECSRIAAPGGWSDPADGLLPAPPTPAPGPGGPIDS